MASALACSKVISPLRTSSRMRGDNAASFKRCRTVTTDCPNRAAMSSAAKPCSTNSR